MCEHGCVRGRGAKLRARCRRPGAVAASARRQTPLGSGSMRRPVRARAHARPSFAANVVGHGMVGCILGGCAPSKVGPNNVCQSVVNCCHVSYRSPASPRLPTAHEPANEPRQPRRPRPCPPLPFRPFGQCLSVLDSQLNNQLCGCASTRATWPGLARLTPRDAARDKFRSMHQSVRHTCIARAHALLCPRDARLATHAARSPKAQTHSTE